MIDVHQHTFRAAEAVECAGEQGEYWEARARFYESYDRLSWRSIGEYGAKVADPDAFRECMDEGVMKERVERHMGEGRQLGVGSIPTFFIAEVVSDREVEVLARITGAQPYSVLEEALMKYLADVEE